jgi:hypothetical protein
MALSLLAFLGAAAYAIATDPLVVTGRAAVEVVRHDEEVIVGIWEDEDWCRRVTYDAEVPSAMCEAVLALDGQQVVALPRTWADALGYGDDPVLYEAGSVITRYRAR